MISKLTNVTRLAIGLVHTLQRINNGINNANVAIALDWS